jgi:hypothetical protein
MTPAGQRGALEGVKVNSDSEGDYGPLGSGRGVSSGGVCDSRTKPLKAALNRIGRHHLVRTAPSRIRKQRAG